MVVSDIPRQLSAWRMLEELGQVSDSPDGLTRTFLSPALQKAKRVTALWMEQAGLNVFEDAAGNLIGRKPSRDPDAPVIACGSHLDTVRQAGRFDGALGVVAGICAAGDLHDLPYHLEIVAFSDEEGVRFQSTYLGSRYYAGDQSVLSDPTSDADGISIRDALKSHHPEFPPPPPRELSGYIEVHIEQGPVLEAAGIPLGVVSSIAGQLRMKITLEGMAGHAGTTPMDMRRDALAGAAECVLALERMARKTEDIVATVGCLDIPNAASNVIPGLTSFTLDIRSGNDAARESFVENILSEIEGIASARKLRTRALVLLDEPSVPCNERLATSLEASVLLNQSLCPSLVSGAGHDAVAISRIAPVAMLFVRCRGGLSHHPDEYASPEDVASAIAALTAFLKNLRP